VKLATSHPEELVGVHEDIEAEEVVIGNAAPQPTHHVDKWVDNEEQRWSNSMNGKIGTIAEPVAEEIFFSELIACCSRLMREWGTEGVVRILSGQCGLSAGREYGYASSYRPETVGGH
jgi:hypothetical protein